MKDKFWSGIATTAIMTALGTTTFLGASQLETVASEIDTSPRKQISETTETTSGSSVLSKSVSATKEDSMVSLFSHQWKDSQAVTLRVRDIPVLTFLGSSTESGDRAEKTASKASDSANNPMMRAQAVADSLNRLSQKDLDARNITVSWNSESQSYKIKVKNKDLVSINDRTILPDTTNDPATDALQVTNRLRRLMGNAPPLTQIAGQPKPKPSKTLAMGTGVKQMRGIASWYGPGFHGRQTANGERFNQNDMTAAHRTLPFGTKVRVTNANTGNSVIVRINDRGPFVGGRVIDLSAAAARALGISGIGQVNIEVLGQ
jgi:rare lipoprotein A